jgi:4-hydroxythreonine-4-phosphate dehydrogenase
MTPVLAITCGDPNGIGPEVALKVASDPARRRQFLPLLIGPEPVFRYYLKDVRSRARLLVFKEEPSREEIPAERSWIPLYSPAEIVHGFPVPGVEGPEGGGAAAGAIRTAVRLALRGGVDGVVTAPVSKHALHAAGFPYPGQTEMLRELTGAPDAVMMLVTRGLRIGLVTIHIPISEVPHEVSAGRIVGRTRIVAETLKRDWRISSPRIALLGLNPHAGESGDIGSEEMTAIRPAIETLRQQGVDCDGPFPADAFFARYRPGRWDAVMAMYHDQGLIPLKSRAGGRGVNITAGLPIVRTSPDHGTAFDIAGTGRADASSMAEAVRLAAQMIRNRRSA